MVRLVPLIISDVRTHAYVQVCSRLKIVARGEGAGKQTHDCGEGRDGIICLNHTDWSVIWLHRLWFEKTQNKRVFLLMRTKMWKFLLTNCIMVKKNKRQTLNLSFQRDGSCLSLDFRFVFFFLKKVLPGIFHSLNSFFQTSLYLKPYIPLVVNLKVSSGVIEIFLKNSICREFVVW